MTLLYLKALHLIFVITWFAGLFYIVRLFIYHTEAHEQSLPHKEAFFAQYDLMEKRLWYGITWPSAIMTAIFGFSQLHAFLPLSNHPWLSVKLLLVLGLYLYHLSCGMLLKRMKSREFKNTSFQLRLWNEVPTLFLVSIVFLAVVKDFLSMMQGLVGLICLIIGLGLGIKAYRKIRLRKASS
jgi:putative membrane protein